MADLNTANAVTSVYNTELQLDQMLSFKKGSTKQYYHTDHLGSIRKLTNASGRVTESSSYEAFGKEKSGGTVTRYGFTGREDESDFGLMYYRARYYDPDAGRFISPDPFTRGPDDPRVSYSNNWFSKIHGEATLYAEWLNPHNFNRYLYCNNNPVNRVDPLGLWDEPGHDDSIEQGLGDSGLSPEQIKVVIKSNNYFDTITNIDGSPAFLHSMLDKGQSIADAIAKRESFKQEKLTAIRESRTKRFDKGDKSLWSKGELELFGELQHPFVDETCPSHGWKVWDLAKWCNPFSNYKKEHQKGDRMTQEGLRKNRDIIKNLFKEASK